MWLDNAPLEPDASLRYDRASMIAKQDNVIVGIMQSETKSKENTSESLKEVRSDAPEWR